MSLEEFFVYLVVVLLIAGLGGLFAKDERDGCSPMCGCGKPIYDCEEEHDS